MAKGGKKKDSAASSAEAANKMMEAYTKMMTTVTAKLGSSISASGKGVSGAGGGNQTMPEKVTRTKPVMEFTCDYSMHGGEADSKGECMVSLDKEKVSVVPKFGEPILIPHRTVTKVSKGNYRVKFDLLKGESLELFGLGYQYEDFLRILHNYTSEVRLKDSLMNEPVRMGGAKCEFVFKDSKGAKKKGNCKASLYETAVGVTPQGGDPLRIPYSSVASISDKDHKVKVTREDGSELTLSMLGDAFTPFVEALSRAYGEVQLKAQRALNLLLPELDVQTLRKVARLMKEGRAAKKSDLDAAVPGIWGKLEARLSNAKMMDGYNFLKPMGNIEKACIGFKEGLAPGLTSSYLWFLLPIYGGGAKKPGNAVAMEVAVGQGGGKATYFFRIVGRKEYAKLSRAEMDSRVDEFLALLIQCMIDINFRRIPIYLPEEKLSDPAFVRYNRAVESLPSLKLLRSHFIGRVSHTSRDAWEKKVKELLAFNVSAKDDSVKWEKEEAVGDELGDAVLEEEAENIVKNEAEEKKEEGSKGKREGESTERDREEREDAEYEDSP